MPAVKIVNSLPIPSVKMLQLEEQFVITGVKSPTALKFILRFTHFSCLTFVFVNFVNKEIGDLVNESSRIYLCSQTLVSAQVSALITAQWFRGDSRKLIAKIRFKERLARQAKAFKTS